MSFPMTIPVSMPQHYNSRFFGGSGPTGSPPPGGSLQPPPPPTAVSASVISSIAIAGGGHQSQMMAPPPPSSSFTTSSLMGTQFMTTSSSSSLSSLIPSSSESQRILPLRKQSVFEAPIGLSALRQKATPSSKPLFTPNSPPDNSSTIPSSRHFGASPDACSASSSSSTSSCSSNGNNGSHFCPLDLSGESSSSLSVITSPVSKEDFSQRINRIIQENQVCLESTDTPYGRRHQQGQGQLGHSHSYQSPYSSSSSKLQSMSNTVQPTQSFVPLPASVITSSSSSANTGRSSLGSGVHPSFQPSFSSVETAAAAAAALSSYSKLQSALLGENKSTEQQKQQPQQQLLSSKVHLGRKYSEIPYHKQPPHPESFRQYTLGGSVYAHPHSNHQPLLLNSNHLHQHQPKSALRPSKHSMVLNMQEHLMEVLPALSESSRSSSEPSLVRNLLTSKTSPFAHLVGTGDAHFLNSSSSSSATATTSSSSSSTTSDSSIIKDLLLRSRHTSLVTINDHPQLSSQGSLSGTSSTNATANTRSTPPPNKRSRTESANFDSSGGFVCPLCQIPFRNRQNLEVHQRVYCRGGNAAGADGSRTTASHQHLLLGDLQQSSSTLPPPSPSDHHLGRLGAKRSYQELGHAPPIPLRKVSVLERPSIITYNASSDYLHQHHHSLPFSSLSTVSINSGTRIRKTSSTDHQQHFSSERSFKEDGDGDNEEEGEDDGDEERKDGSFGNILKSKLLSRDDSYASMIPLKKRKISEPAFRYHDDKHRDSFIRPHKLSIMQPPVLSRQERSTVPKIEILPAYLPYLQPASVKITIKSPVLFPVLQDLLDTGTNHEFVVEDSIVSSSFGAPLVVDLEEERKQFEEEEEVVLLPTTTQSETNLVTSKDEKTGSLEEKVKATIDSLLDKVVASLSSETSELSTPSTTAVKKTSPARPTSLDIGRRSYDQSARNERELSTDIQSSSKDISRKSSTQILSIFVNRCSNQDDELDNSSKSGGSGISTGKSNQNLLVASTLISPDTPRAKRKYQQLHINGHAYTNLGLKVNPRPTYCCLYRLQPMFVTQEANPQLSMYSQWKTAPLPPGDILQTALGSDPRALLAAYNSAEAVFEVSRSRLSLVEVVTAATMGGLETGAETAADKTASAEEEKEKVVAEEAVALPEIVKPTGTVTREFLDRVAARLTNHLSGTLQSSASVRLGSSNEVEHLNQGNQNFRPRHYDRTFQAAIISLSGGFSVRLADTCARSQYILTHSSYHRLASQARAQLSQANRAARKRSRTHAVDFAAKLAAAAPGAISKGAAEMVIAGTSASPTTPTTQYLSLAEQASRLPLSETGVGNFTLATSSTATSTTSSSLKLPELASFKPRKRSSTTNMYHHSNSATSLSSSPYLTMHPMLGHLSAKTKQTVMYIMMMGQAPMASSVPTLSSLATSKNLASRKFSECIGMKAMASSIEAEAAWAAGGTGRLDVTSEMIPKRIKIFEGGFKSNEDYTYVRGRGRGKYVCEECGIRCKKPSMLKKHIRTHTDLRPYSCRHCAFAFKTKGNLTKHMKSKAHHKKCVELGIIPVPTSIDDSQIDSDALAKQEQYELSCGGSTGGLHQFADDDEDCDEDYDEEEYEEEDEEEDEGVPIPLIEQQRLTYIVPGQFDDAEGGAGEGVYHSQAEAVRVPRSHKNSDCSSTLSATSFSPRPKLSISSLTGVSVASCSAGSTTTTVASSLLSSASSTLPLSITDIRPTAPAGVLAEENDKVCSSINHHQHLLGSHRKVSSSSRGSSNHSSTVLSPSTSSSKMMLSSNSPSSGSSGLSVAGELHLNSLQHHHIVLPTPNQQQQQPHHRQGASASAASATCALQSYHFGQISSGNQNLMSGTATSQQSPPQASAPSSHQSQSQTQTQSNSITKEHEAEAARSLLILSGVSAHHSSNDSRDTSNSKLFFGSSANATFAASAADSDNVQQQQHRLAYSKRKTSSSAVEQTPKDDHNQQDRRINYEVASDHVLLASQSQQQLHLQQQIQQQQQNLQSMASTEHSSVRQHSPIEMMRRISAQMTPVAVHNPAVVAATAPAAAAKVDRRTSQPTSVIISNSNSRVSQTTVSEQQQAQQSAAAAVLEAHGITNYNDFIKMVEEQQQQQQTQWKRSRHERSISESSAFGMPAHAQLFGLSPLAATSGSAHLQQQQQQHQQLLQQQYASSLQQQQQGALRNPRAALIAEEIKRAANSENVTATTTTLQQQQQHHHQAISAHLQQLQQLQQAQSRMVSVINAGAQQLSPSSNAQQQSTNGALPQAHLPTAAVMDPTTQSYYHQNLMAKIYETMKQQQSTSPTGKQQQPLIFPGFPGLTNVDLAKLQQQQQLLSNLSMGAAGINGTSAATTTSSQKQLKVQQSISPSLSAFLVPPPITNSPDVVVTSSGKKNSSSGHSYEKESLIAKRKSPSLSSSSYNKVPSPQNVSSGRHFSPGSVSQVPLPPPPASPRPAPSVGTGGKSDKAAGSSQQGEDQPMDLSAKPSNSTTSTLLMPAEMMAAAIRGVSPTSMAELAAIQTAPSRRSPPSAVQLQLPAAEQRRQPSPTAALQGGSSHQMVAAAVTAAQQLHHSSPNRHNPNQQHRFRPMIEEKLLTEQLVRAFSPHNELHQISLPRAAASPSQSGREAYKNIRSEEFAHLTPGVHTPHRLPQNMLLLGARGSSGNNGAAVLVSPTATATSSSASASSLKSSPGGSSAIATSVTGPVARVPNSIPNAYTNAEGKSVCTICMKQFSKPSQLRLHINIHFFERPFRCDSCAVSFRTKGHLQKHSRSVSHLNKLNMNITFGRPSTDNPRPFKCSDCKIAFRIHGHLAKHLRSKMHIMKLECLGKLPFGMFAEMERSNINLTPIDTTDCEKALESLRALAQKLYDPRQMTWQVMEPSAGGAGDGTDGDGDESCIEEELMMDEDFGEEDEEEEEGLVGYADGSGGLEHMSAGPSATATSTLTSSPPLSLPPANTACVSSVPAAVSPPVTLPPPATTAQATNSSSGIASTRSNTCHLCGRTFKAAKFLQVHLYCDHPTAESSGAGTADGGSTSSPDTPAFGSV